LTAAPVGIAAGLDRDAIVTGIERTVFNQHIGTRFRIAAVVIGAVRVDVDICGS